MRRLNLTSNLFKRFITLAIIFSLSSSLFAQTKPAEANTAKNTKPTAQKCSGVWTGSVKYTLTQTNNESKTEPRFLGTVGEDTKRTELKYEYKANVVVAENASKKQRAGDNRFEADRHGNDRRQGKSFLRPGQNVEDSKRKIRARHQSFR